MADMLKYWAKVKSIKATLPDVVWLMSIENEMKGTKEGQVVCCERELAARCLVDATHRRATGEEVEAHQRTLAENQERLKARAAARAPEKQPLQIFVGGAEQQITQLGPGAIQATPAASAESPRARKTA